MELTKQDINPNPESFTNYFVEFLQSVYTVEDVDPRWIATTYEPLERMTATVHASIGRTIEKIVEIAPTHGKLTRTEVLSGIDTFLDWLANSREQLAVVGGPMIYLAVYCLAGSPEAARFLKIPKARAGDTKSVVRNVAWDLMYWVHLNFHYHYAKYKHTIICSQDESMVELLLTRKNLGPRQGPSLLFEGEVVNSFGEFSPPSLARIDDTALSDVIAQRLLSFWSQMKVPAEDEVWFTPFQNQ